MSDRSMGAVPTVFANLLMGKRKARASLPAARSSAAPASRKPKMQEPDRRSPGVATQFTHLLGNRPRHAASAPVEIAPTRRQTPAAEVDAQARADFILQAGAKARGEIPIPRAKPQTDDERRAQAGADRIMAAAAKAWPDRHGGAK